MRNGALNQVAVQKHWTLMPKSRGVKRACPRRLCTRPRRFPQLEQSASEGWFESCPPWPLLKQSCMRDPPFPRSSRWRPPTGRQQSMSPEAENIGLASAVRTTRPLGQCETATHCSCASLGKSESAAHLPTLSQSAQSL